MKEYLVEITKACRHWIEASSKEEAMDIAEQMEESDNVDINDIEILDVREIDSEYYMDDEDFYD